jgi:hypothetical protein
MRARSRRVTVERVEGSTQPADGDAMTTVACRRCGRPIALVGDAAGSHVPDREAFLRIHRRCLTAAAREASLAHTGRWGD